jgi:hypothetical protein
MTVVFFCIGHAGEEVPCLNYVCNAWNSGSNKFLAVHYPLVTGAFAGSNSAQWSRG